MVIKMLKSWALCILIFSSSTGWAANQCVDLFIGRPTDKVQYHFQRALGQGKLLMGSTKSSDKITALRSLYPEGFLLHGTATPVVEMALKKQGRFIGSKNISSSYWSESRDLTYRRLRKNLDDYRTFYFQDSRKESFLEKSLSAVESYANSSAQGFHVLKELGLDIHGYAELKQLFTFMVLGEFSTLEDLRIYHDDLLPKSTLDKIDEVLGKIEEPLDDIYELSAQRKGVVLILNRVALKKTHNYQDPETGGQFFLLPPGKSISMEDVLAIIPLSEEALQDLENLVIN
jgi:hypothetical protein